MVMGIFPGAANARDVTPMSPESGAEVVPASLPTTCIPCSWHPQEQALRDLANIFRALRIPEGLLADAPNQLFHS